MESRNVFIWQGIRFTTTRNLLSDDFMIENVIDGALFKEERMKLFSRNYIEPMPLNIYTVFGYSLRHKFINYTK